MILSCQNISKAFVENQVLKNVSFHIEDHEKAAIVGINGAGKTTLLRIIVGEMTPDDGQVVLARDKTLGYLAQNSTVDTSHTIYEELLSVKADLLRLEEKIQECENNMKHAEGDALEDLMKQYTSLTHAFETGGGYLYRSELVGVLKGLGFTEDEFSKPVATLSGGQKTRVALGRLLLQNPDLIILDEPTNHLDMNSIAWLETYLLNYKGAVLIVSHDRYFLDRIAGKVIEIDQSKATTFMGNYSDYAVKKEQLRVAAWNAYMNQQREIKHQEEVIEKLKSFNREKSIKRAESREKMLDKIEVIEKPSEVRTDMKLTLTPRILSGNDVLTVEHLAKSFDSHKLFTDVNFEIKRGEHVAIIGDNGSGKTTLLKILNGLVPADQGTFRLGSNVEIGYYDQEHHVLHSEKTLFEEISDDYPYLNNTQIRNVLAAFLFTGEDVFKRISDLSGGERGRVSLAKLVLSNANFLILDEPTNHLDMNSIAWLETYLLNYKGAVLIVSHDRYFLDRIAGKVIEIDQSKATTFMGNYSDYAVKKEQLRVAAWNAYMNQQREIKHQEEVIEKLKSFNREKSIKRAESREKMLDKIEVIEKPSEVRTDMKLTLTPRILSGNDVLTVEHLAKSFDSHKLFTDVNFEIKRGEHVAIIGDNGSGKTTLLKILNGLVPADQGTFRLGSNVEIGYYDQEHHVLHSEKTLFEEISDDYPYLNNTQIRNVLAAFLFTGEDVFKRISDLSGGERGRVSLAKLVLSNANFLILDEPTNHLDIMSKEILEDALNGYEGTILYVSHDRYFINRTAHRILDLTDGQFVNYVGNYDYYLEKHDTVMAAIEASVPQSADADNTVAAKVAESEVKLDWKAQKEEQARLRKKENDLKKCEEQIARLEARVSEIDTEMSDPAIGTQVAKLQELTKEQTACQEQLEKLYEQWEELAE